MPLLERATAWATEEGAPDGWFHEELAEEYNGRAVIGKMDVDQNKEIATKLGIQAIPTLLIVKGGQIADRIVGVVDKKSLRARLDELL